MARVFVRAEITTTILQELLQYLRDFESRHCDEFESNIRIEAPDMTGEEIEAVLDRVRPPFAYRTTVCTKEGKLVGSKVRG
jgi:hypothetical protein